MARAGSAPHWEDSTRVCPTTRQGPASLDWAWTGLLPRCTYELGGLHKHRANGWLILGPCVPFSHHMKTEVLFHKFCYFQGQRAASCHLENLFVLIKFAAGDVAWWQRLCLACTTPWVRSSAPAPNMNHLETSYASHSL